MILKNVVGNNEHLNARKTLFVHPLKTEKEGKVHRTYWYILPKYFENDKALFCTSIFVSYSSLNGHYYVEN